MNAPLSLQDIATDDHAEWAQAGLRRQVGVLEQLAEAGLRLALSIESRAAEAPVDDAPQITMAFSRVARAVRMTALLHARLIKDMDEARSRAAYARTRDAETQAEDAELQDPAYGHKARVEAIVARVAKTHSDSPDHIEALVREAGERLDDDDIYGDVLTRPVGELVALICRDLGLEPDWERLSQEAWAQAEMVSGIATSPFARPLPLAGEGDHEVVERALPRTTPKQICAPSASP